LPNCLKQDYVAVNGMAVGIVCVDLLFVAPLEASEPSALFCLLRIREIRPGASPERIAIWPEG
jgi:hypothetical protein